MLVRNSAAQLTGRVSSLSANLIGIPFYLAYLDVEAYAIVGIYLSLQAFFGLLDFGLPITANRQISISLSGRMGAVDAYKIARSFEVFFLTITLTGFLILFFLAAPIAHYWLNPEKLAPTTVQSALEMAALAAALRFPNAFYSNALFAFERHLLPNTIAGLAAFARVGVAIVLMEFFTTDLAMFFLAHIAVNSLELLCSVLALWVGSNGGWKSRFDIGIVRSSFKLTATLSGVSLTAFILSQSDKVILTRVLSLDDFGIYSVAQSVALSVLLIAYAVGSAVFPSLSRLIANRETSSSAHKIKYANRLILIFSGSLGIFLVTQFPLYGPVLSVLTEEADKIIQILPWVAFGAWLQSQTVLPHGYMVALGWPQRILVINLVHIIPYCLLLYGLATTVGLSGAAGAFVLLNLSISLCLWMIVIFKTETGSAWFAEVRTSVFSFLCLTTACYSVVQSIPEPTSLMPSVLSSAASGFLILMLVACLSSWAIMRSLIQPLIKPKD